MRPVENDLKSALEQKLCLEDAKDYDDKGHEVIDGKYQNFVIRPHCKKTVSYWFCNTCGKTHSRFDCCHTFYCEKCYSEKFKRHYANLMRRPIRSKRLLHFSIGFPKKTVSIPHAYDHAYMSTIMRKFVAQMKKKGGLSLLGFRVFDLADDGQFLHFHFGVVPVDNRMFDRERLALARRILKKISNGVVRVIRVHGFRYRKSLIGYFAERLSGRFGHGKEAFFLSDIMTYQDYHSVYARIRKLVVLGGFPVGLCANTGTSESCTNAIRFSRHCPFCKSYDLKLIAIREVGEEFYPSEAEERWRYEQEYENVVEKQNYPEQRLNTFMLM